MKISSIQTFIVRSSLRNFLLLEIQTSSGMVGLGEATVEGREKTVEAAIKENARYLIGKDPHNIEELWQAMYKGAFWRGGPILNSAISGIEIALWDILGKELGAPIHQFLGGPCRSKIRAYTWPEGDTIEEKIESSKEFVKRNGFTAIKFAPYSSVEGDVKPESHITRNSFGEAVRRVRMMREALGDEIDILIDFHGRPTLSETVRLANEIEKYNPFFIEEPVTPENVDAVAIVRNSTRTPIATGERLFTKFGFRELLEKNACQIVQPDLCHAGGILEGKKIAAMAECYFVQVAPHNPLSPVSTAACLQLDSCIPNFCIQECTSSDMEFKKKLIKNCPEIHEGHFEIPSRPGLGIELNHDVINDRPYEEKDLPRMRRDDGSIAEW